MKYTVELGKYADVPIRTERCRLLRRFRLIPSLLNWLYLAVDVLQANGWYVERKQPLEMVSNSRFRSCSFTKHC